MHNTTTCFPVRTRLLILLCFPFCLQSFLTTNAVGFQEPARGRNGMVATVNAIATDAGVTAFQRGGNAVDAAIAASLMLGVVDNFNSGIGGGCFILIRKSSGEVIAIDGREMAPSAAHRDMYFKNGKPDTQLSQLGALASGVPGALKAYEKAIQLAGKKKLSDWVRPAAKVAREGFKVSRVYAGALRSRAHQIRRFPSTKKVLLKPDGNPFQEGEVLRQIDLANTYDKIALLGTDWFYSGPFAKATETWMQANGGILTAKDFARYVVKLREPVVSNFRGHQIIGFPPPSSGGIHVAQILNILENFKPLKNYDRATRTHLIVEAMKLAFADRAYWLGDSDFAKVPKGLIDKDYASLLAKKIDLSKSTLVESHGHPPSKDGNFSEKHTTHIAAADAEGNWVAITQTVNTTFGSKVIIPGTGVVMNNEMDDFSVAPGIANAFGLLGAEANSVSPGKRPLSSMSPTIVLKNGKPVMTVGAAGGPKIITQSLLATLGFIELGLPIDKALSQPRFHHQWSPDRILVESSMPDAIIK
ncbi:MAG: gamma-glutamyltransferase, partial [Planctomycetota bacterium]|nr:gamma-glutamyltransferase [Planctomycetota bacterium]